MTTILDWIRQLPDIVVTRAMKYEADWWDRTYCESMSKAIALFVRDWSKTDEPYLWERLYNEYKENERKESSTLDLD